MKISAARPNFGGIAFTRSILSRLTREKTTSFTILTLLFFALPFFSGCVGITNGLGASTGQISILPDSVSFGSVALGSTSSQTVAIVNEGQSSVLITQANTKAAGISLKGIALPLVIGAGKRAFFEIVYKPKKAGALTGNVFILSNRSNTPDLVSLKGIGTASLALLDSSASDLKFGSVALGKSGTLPITLTNKGNSDITLSNVSVSGASFSTSGVAGGLILAPGQSAKLDAKFTPKTNGGANGSIKIVSNATNSPETISLSGDGGSTGSHSVTLTWNGSTTGVAGYNVYRSQSSSGPFQKLDTIFGTTQDFVDSTVQAGLTYYYMLTSFNDNGVESADSIQVSVTIPMS